MEAKRRNTNSGLGSTWRRLASPVVNISRNTLATSSRYIIMMCQSIGRMATLGTDSGLRTERR